jgi:hypothetical protein
MHKFPPVNCCIYCRTSDKELGDEHVVPYALGGNYVLPKASCPACSRITARFEGVTCRTTLGNLRMRYGFPTHRKRDRPNTIEIGTLNEDGSTGRRDIPVQEYPIGAFIPYFGRAGFFLGAPPNLDVLQATFKNHPTDELEDLTRIYNWDGRISIKWMPNEYALTIMKIAHCYAVSALNVDGFETIAVPYILGEESNFSYIFGQVGENTPASSPSPVWDVSLRFEQKPNGVLLVAHVSLLPGMGTPIYEVIVGYLKTAEHVERLNKHLTQGHIFSISETAS